MFFFFFFFSSRRRHTRSLCDWSSDVCSSDLHMTSLMGYVRTLFQGGSYPVKPEPLPSFTAEVERFHEMVEAVGTLLASNAKCSISTEQLLQGPFADTMTHVGQLAMLRRLADAPVAPENFIYADIRADRLHADQPPPARPDKHWPEKP